MKTRQIKTLISIFLWLWVIVITAAYGWQFIDYVDPILAIFGIR